VRRHQAESGKDSCPNSSLQKGTARRLFRPACTNSVRVFSCFHISSVLISNGKQKMKSHTQSRHLLGRPGPLLLAQRVVPGAHGPRISGRDSQLTAHAFLIATQILDIRLTYSPQTRKHSLIATYSGYLPAACHAARGRRALPSYRLPNYQTRTGRRDFGASCGAASNALTIQARAGPALKAAPTLGSYLLRQS
jgi:hypothetical protein